MQSHTGSSIWPWDRGDKTIGQRRNGTSKQRPPQPRQQPQPKRGAKRAGTRQRNGKRQQEANTIWSQGGARHNKADAQRQVHLLLISGAHKDGSVVKLAYISTFGLIASVPTPLTNVHINVESRAAYLKQRVVSVRFALRSHRSQKEGNVGEPTNLAVLPPASTSVQAQCFPLVLCEGTVWAYPHHSKEASPSVQSPSVLSVQSERSGVGVRTPKRRLQACNLSVFVRCSMKGAVLVFPHCPQWMSQCQVLATMSLRRISFSQFLHFRLLSLQP